MKGVGELAKLTKFLLVIAVVIGACEYSAKLLAEKANASEVTKTLYSLNHGDLGEGLIVGSSRANHHYDCKVLEDTLGMRFYNAGEDGFGLSLVSPLMEAMLSNNMPRVIVLELLPSDLGGSLNSRISKFKYLADRDSSIYDALVLEDANNRWKLKSHCYRLNGEAWLNLLKTRGKAYDATLNGFTPMAKNRHGFKVEEREYEKCDDVNSLHYFRRMVELAKSRSIALVVAVSPEMFDRQGVNGIEKICAESGVTFIDNSKLEYFWRNTDLFRDKWHLDREGARIYSSIFASQLKSVLDE